MLIALLIALLFGGGEEAYIIPQFEKYTKKHIVEEKQKQALQNIFDDYDEVQKTLGKQKKQRGKAFQKLQENDESSPELFQELLDQFQAGEQKHIEQAIIWNIDLRKNLTNEQWDEALVKASNDTSKLWKAFHKNKSSLLKRVTKVNATVAKKIKDPEHYTFTTEKLSTLEQTFKQILDEYEVSGAQSILVTTAYKSKPDDIRESKITLLELKKRLVSEFMQTQFDLKQTLSDEEWQKVKKAFNSVL